MVSNAEASAAGSQERIESAFLPGNLAEKRDAIIRMREAGDTLFFEGGVKWTVTLPDHDKQLNGVSETLDDAFFEMAACLNFLSEDHQADTQVICAVEADGDAP